MGPQGFLPSIFEFLFSRCISLHFFRRFDLFFTSFFKVFNLLMIGSPCTNRVTNLWAVAQTWPLFFTPTSTSPPPSPLHHEAVEPNLHRHPYTKTSTAIPTPRPGEVQGLPLLSSDRILNEWRAIIVLAHVQGVHQKVWCYIIQGVPGGKDLTSGECSLGQTIPI